MGESGTGKGESDLSTLSLESVKNCLEGRMLETAGVPCMLIILEPPTQPLQAVIESVPEWLVYAL